MPYDETSLFLFLAFFSISWREAFEKQKLMDSEKSAGQNRKRDDYGIFPREMESDKSALKNETPVV